MNEINFLVVIIINIIIIIIIIINIYLGSIYKYNGSSPYKLREVKVLVVKYYRHPYIHKLNSADKETQFF